MNAIQRKILCRTVHRWVVVSIACCLPSMALAQYEPGPTRDAFIEGGAQSCFARQKTAPDNNHLSDVVLRAYCQCFITSLANIISPEYARVARQQEGLSLLGEKFSRETEVAWTHCTNEINKGNEYPVPIPPPPGFRIVR